ncbi:PEP-CTERM sorting domain-containing protein [Duganella sp. BJB475]|nr:PEP-CTERM sorting domain-containing protein [Duganella sp. BJB475]RFP29800.1 PEP-CTERM sorting domain-containing protein [Duganella sp. BJB476]
MSTLLLAMALSAGAASANALSENFDGGVPSGWTVVNNSNPLGDAAWFQGNPMAFNAQQGAPNSYIGAAWTSGKDVSAISNWLILPTSTYHNGDTLSFYTRTVESSPFPDRLEVRFSNVGGVNVGGAADSVGSFSSLLLSVNPGQDTGVYPDAWTKYSVTLNGLSGATNGAFAFHYSLDDGGPNGTRSNLIGIDTVSITAVPEPSTYLMLGAGLGLVGLARKRKAKAA